MSTFSGLIPELPGIAIDCFDDQCRSGASLFFLSHCHTDHMRGLSDPAPLTGSLYMSPVSSVLIRHRFPLIADAVRELTLLEVVTQRVVPCDGSEPYELYVRTLPADHCPGSVMFYFETELVRVLYTGDFRPTPETRSAMALIRPQIVYLDSTFLSQRCAHFPTREASTEKIVQLCREWLQASPRNVVSLWLPAAYGSEDLFRQLHQGLHERIHVSDSQRRSYAHFAMLHEALTDDAGARIHACSGTVQQGNRLACREAAEAHRTDDPSVRTIRPSALRWRGLQPGDTFWSRSNNLHHVCYSTHASYNELGDVIRLLQPEARCIRFNVIEDAADEVEKERLVAAILEATAPSKATERSSPPMKVDPEEREVGELLLERIVYNKRKHWYRDDSDSDRSGEDEYTDKLPKRTPAGD
uniref:Protein artemis n=1 Tax=Anopheles dirus TaxID=7168 RepID=A0A182N057_9DIPT